MVVYNAGELTFGFAFSVDIGVVDGDIGRGHRHLRMLMAFGLVYRRSCCGRTWAGAEVLRMLRVQEVHAGLIFGWLSAQLLRLSALTLVVGDHERVAPSSSIFGARRHVPCGNDCRASVDLSQVTESDYKFMWAHCLQAYGQLVLSQDQVVDRTKTHCSLACPGVECRVHKFRAE